MRDPVVHSSTNQPAGPAIAYWRTTRSEHPELQFRGVRHPVFVPRRVPDDVHVRVGDAGQLLQLVDDFHRKALSGGAARRRQRHADTDHVFGVDGDLVDEAELVDVDGDLGVKDRREHLDDLRLHRESLDRVTTLEDRAGCRARIRSHSRRLFGARRVFVGELDDMVRHGRRSRYSASVDTTSSFASTAERSVCQARLAHFTRAGEFRTPSNTASLPSRSGWASGSALPVTIWWNCPNTSRVSLTVLPLTLAGIIDADAFESAHPDPWKPAS